ncbi:MAG: transporter, ATP-binding protein, partial [Caulobacter sp.]|nr:transporter, ATP-binding protein [Caulobacter sp.]
MSSPTLSLRGVKRTYQAGSGPLEVLKGVDLDVMPGEIVGLIGPSGSGKSSLLHAAGLLEHPTEGQVIIAGQDCTTLGDRPRTLMRLANIGFVYQFHHLLPELTALENVVLPQRMAGLSRKESVAYAETLLQRLGLGERLQH